MVMVVMAVVMATTLRGGWDLTMTAVASFVVSSVVLSLKVMGAFTFYTWFDEPIPTPGGTVSRYGRSVIPLIVKFSTTWISDLASFVMTPAWYLPLNNHDLLQILCIPAHNNKPKGYAGSRSYWHVSIKSRKVLVPCDTLHLGLDGDKMVVFTSHQCCYCNAAFYIMFNYAVFAALSSVCEVPRYILAAVYAAYLLYFVALCSFLLCCVFPTFFFWIYYAAVNLS